MLHNLDVLYRVLIASCLESLESATANAFIVKLYFLLLDFTFFSLSGNLEDFKSDLLRLRLGAKVRHVSVCLLKYTVDSDI